jgi:sialic acid synthase SpsE
MNQKRESCYIIAEAGSNHNREFSKAIELIDVAASAGANAVKFQLFKADKLYTKKAGASDYLQTKRSIFDIIKDAELPLEWLPSLKKRCDELSIDFMASAFDEDSVDALDPFVAAHKCASYELTHAPLLSHLAKKGKPLIVSTGAANMAEVEAAVRVMEDAQNFQITLLQCTASYPTPLNHANVRAMVTLRKRFGYAVGLSDHTREPSLAPCAAVALGAKVIEKHFTLSNLLPGPDHRFALEPQELRRMVMDIRATEKVLGDGEKEPLSVEQELRQFARRCIFTSKPIRAGEVFSPDNLIILRSGKAGHGLPPESYQSILGKASRKEIDEQTPVTYEDVFGELVVRPAESRR